MRLFLIAALMWLAGCAARSKQYCVWNWAYGEKDKVEMLCIQAYCKEGQTWKPCLELHP